jgi:Tol biopolymer transport system component
VRQITNRPEDDWQAMWSPDGGEFVFFSGRKMGNTNLWIMSIDGNELRQITFDEPADGFPVWSPNGSMIAYSRGTYAASELYLISPQGGEPVQLTNNKWAFLASRLWSEDGETIYALGQGGGYSGITLWAISASSGDARVLIDVKGSFREPYFAISMDKERLYFTAVERLGDLWMAELAVEE